MLTQAELKRKLHYCPDTGIFTWIAPSKYNPCLKGMSIRKKNSEGYIVVKLNYKLYKAHRLAWLYVHGKFPNEQIDHINGIADDNRLCNLREATQYENMKNRNKLSNNKSGFKGVSFHKQVNKWRARAGLNGKLYNLGVFSTPEEASEAYKAFALKHHGEFIRI